MGKCRLGTWITGYTHRSLPRITQQEKSFELAAMAFVRETRVSGRVFQQGSILPQLIHIIDGELCHELFDRLYFERVHRHRRI